MKTPANSRAFFYSNTWSLASSSLATSSSESLQPSAPAFSCAWLTFFAPGIGSVPLQIAQLRATCEFDFPPWSCPMAVINLMSGSIFGRRLAYVPPRVPGGRLLVSYFPVNNPCSSGLYAIKRIPNSLHLASRPFFSTDLFNKL